MMHRRTFIKLTGAAFLAAALPGCGSSGEDVDRSGFGFHLNPVMINGPALQGFHKGVYYIHEPRDTDSYFSYETPLGVRHLQLPLLNGLAKSYPVDQDYHRMKEIGDFVVSNIWEHYWNSSEDAQEMRNVIERCAGNALKLIVRLEDVSRISNHPQAGPTDETWFTESFEPYVRSIVQYGIGKIWGYQVWNEAWEPNRFLLGPTGSMITNEQYIQHLARVRAIIKEEDPGAVVTNSAMTSIVESQYNSRTKNLLKAGLESHTDFFNFHYFAHGSVSAEDELKLIELDTMLDKDVLVTEVNHIVPTSTDQSKFETIMKIRAAVARWFKMRGLMAFCWNAGTADTELVPWVIKDTPLEDLLRREFNPQ